jgi:hypothetical protein
MTFDPKPITREGIPTALRKADRYRLINDPSSAESICRDVLLVEPRNQEARITLLLAITDQFGEAPTEGVRRAQELLPDLEDDYERAYYAGIICERWAGRLLHLGAPGAGPIAYEWLRRAMARYEEAEALRAPGEDDAILRWNTCARLIERNPHARPASDEPEAPIELE